MWFKNLLIYRLPPWDLSASQLEERLHTRELQPCAPFDMQSRGWVAPCGTGRLLHTLARQHLLALGVDQKLLPGSIIRQETLRRAAAQAVEQGFPVGRRQLRDLRLRVTEELRARALTRRRTTRAWLDPVGGWCVVDAAGPARAEELIETLRDTLGSFAVQPVATQRSPRQSMAAWLTQGSAPGRLGLDQDLELAAVDGSRSSIRYTRHPLDPREVRAHLAQGKHPVRLGLTWGDRISFVLTERLQIKRVQFLGLGADEEAGAGERGADAGQEQFDADFSLMTGELARLLAEVVAALGGESPAQAAA